MISSAYVRVECNKCEYAEEIGLTPLADGSWDERNVDGKLKRLGWKVDGDSHICPECQEDAQ